MSRISNQSRSGAGSRRNFLKASTAVAAGMAWGPAGLFDLAGAEALAAAELPKGAAPAPVDIPHFPSRLHAFVWRNWPLVPVARMAQVVGARPADLRRLGAAMGLGEPPRITRDQQRRSYLTVIKRNWHLLPYEQLLELLGWTAEEMAYTLREDDFLYVKLGNLKPQCAPLRYAPPDEAAQQRARAIGRVVREAFPGGVAGPEPLFHFVAKLSAAPPPTAARPPAADRLRFCYSYFALYGDPLLEAEADPYPEGYLARMAQAGVNGVWLQAVLQKLAPFPWEPARHARYEERLKNLRALVARARRHGLQVFLYLNEPRALPGKFFAARPQVKGVAEGDHAALCTSAPEVQQYLKDSLASICRAVPDLGGFFTITASENLSNCWSHGQGAACPRCGRRAAPEVIAEVNRLFAEGIRQSGVTPAPRLIAWDWGWADGWAPEAIRQLPAEAALMSVSEWSLPIERGGVKSAVGEYSISAVGPGPRARKHWELAQQRGLQTLAKVQAGNTWELSAVPWIPAVENVATHAANLRGMNTSGLMLGWTLGGYPSPNLEVVAEAMAGGSAGEAMQRVAERRYGAELAPLVIQAWRGYSAAFREFPYHGGVLYQGPQQLGPANLLWARPTQYRSTMVGFAYDDLEGWRAIYPPEVFIGQMQKVAEGFDQALRQLQQALRGRPQTWTPAQQQALAEELGVAEAAALHFRSAANQARFVLARRGLLAAKTSGEAAPIRAAMAEIVREEAALAVRLHALQGRDSRLGFEASNHYFYVPVDLAEKVVNCRHLLEQLEGNPA